MLAAFRRGLAQAGLLEGRDIVLAIHYLDGDFSRLPPLAEAIVAARPRVVAVGPTSAVAALRRASTTIPLVMVSGADPVGAGLARSLARPGGNVTGLSNQGVDLLEKQFSLMPELLPRARSALGLRGGDSTLDEPMEAAFLRAASGLGLSARALVLGERPDGDLRTALAELRPDALFAFPGPIPFAHRRAIVAAAAEARVAAVAPFREFVELGALASYGASLAGSWERTAWFVDRILKGANPAEMPIEQPTRFELLLNLRTARALGVDIPAVMLARADEVIE
jgi:putative ABC transport system substrate-binding protein